MPALRCAECARFCCSLHMSDNPDNLCQCVECALPEEDRVSRIAQAWSQTTASSTAGDEAAGPVEEPSPFVAAPIEPEAAQGLAAAWQARAAELHELATVSPPASKARRIAVDAEEEPAQDIVIVHHYPDTPGQLMLRGSHYVCSLHQHFAQGTLPCKPCKDAMSANVYLKASPGPCTWQGFQTSFLQSSTRRQPLSLLGKRNQSNSASLICIPLTRNPRH